MRLNLMLPAFLILAVLGALLLTRELTRGDEYQFTPTMDGGNADRGRELISRYGCSSCHTVPGVTGANGRAGPPLGALSQHLIIAGRLPNKPDELIHWIEDPQGVDPGTAMPNLGVSDKDARDIAKYLYSLH
jgi:cytochrome c